MEDFEMYLILEKYDYCNPTSLNKDYHTQEIIKAMQEVYTIAKKELQTTHEIITGYE